MQDFLRQICERVKHKEYQISAHAETEREAEEITMKAKKSKRIPNSFCSGELEDTVVQHPYRWKDKIYVFENVPAQVCRQCGEKIL